MNKSLIIFSWSVGQGSVGQACDKRGRTQFVTYLLLFPKYPYDKGDKLGTSDCVKNVILSEAKDLKWPKNEILRYTQNDKKREKCFFTQSDSPFVLLEKHNTRGTGPVVSNRTSVNLKTIAKPLFNVGE